MSDVSSVSKERDYRLWVNEEKTVLVTFWRGGSVTVATRETPAHTWGPPVYCEEEQ